MYFFYCSKYANHTKSELKCLSLEMHTFLVPFKNFNECFKYSTDILLNSSQVCLVSPRDRNRF